MSLSTMTNVVHGPSLAPPDLSRPGTSHEQVGKNALGSLFDQHMADHIAQGSGLGLAQFFQSTIDKEPQQHSLDTQYQGSIEEK